ncbi:polycystin-2 [Clonorchis sinensis]|uniref:Polycystin-2 n=1 Tax=Clonorchis sinensis TaxID=79923 RepID=G7YS68_CLOSI|nr:polycystin-2 [Clonorchis sinensis]
MSELNANVLNPWEYDASLVSGISGRTYRVFAQALTKRWKYQTAGQLGSAAVAAQYGAYPGSGYVQDLSRSLNTSEEIIQELFEGRWIDEASRVLFLDFTIYNANINMFVIVKLIFELPVTGGVFVSSEFQPAKLVRYLTATDYFVMACEIMYLMFILYYIVEEILEIRKQGFRYFRGVWNILDIVVILLSLICAGFTIYCTVTAYDVMTNMLKDINAHPHFDQLSYWYGHWVRATALCVFFVVIKIFKYVNFDRSLGQLTKTLGTAAFDMIGFMIMFCIIFFAFAQLGYLAFGTSIEGFRSFTQACYTLFRIMVGDIDFVALRRAHFFLGPLFFVVFIFFAVFVLLNMFLAIVNDAYATVKEDLVKQKTQLKLKDMVKKSAREMIKRMRKKSSKTLVQILRSTGLFGREVIPFDDFRVALKRHGYGDTEITATFVKYDTDGDNCLNMKEQRQMEDDIEIGVRTTLKQHEEDEGHGTDEEGEQDENADPGAVEYVDPDDYAELVERVEALEASLLELLSHGDELLAVLEQVELAKREHRKNLMEMMGNMRAIPSEQNYSNECETDNLERNWRYKRHRHRPAAISCIVASHAQEGTRNIILEAALHQQHPKFSISPTPFCQVVHLAVCAIVKEVRITTLVSEEGARRILKEHIMVIVFKDEDDVVCAFQNDKVLTSNTKVLNAVQRSPHYSINDEDEQNWREWTSYRTAVGKLSQSSLCILTCPRGCDYRGRIMSTNF